MICSIEKLRRAIVIGRRSPEKPGWMPVPCRELLPASPAGPEACDLVRSRRVGEHETHRGDEVLARLEDATHVVEISVERRVVHAIGVQGEDLVDAVGRDHADRVDARDLAGVAPDLFGRRDVAADQFELRVAA